MPDDLTVPQAASRLGVCTAMVYSMCASKELGHYRYGALKGAIRIPAAALEKLKQERYVEPVPRERVINVNRTAAPIYTHEFISNIPNEGFLVRQHVKLHPGQTADEIAEATGVKLNAVRAYLGKPDSGVEKRVANGKKCYFPKKA